MSRNKNRMKKLSSQHTQHSTKSTSEKPDSGLATAISASETEILTPQPIVESTMSEPKSSETSEVSKKSPAKITGTSSTTTTPHKAASPKKSWNIFQKISSSSTKTKVAASPKSGSIASSAETGLGTEDLGLSKENITNKIATWLKNFNFKKKVKDPICWVRFAAYAIPVAFLLYVLYMNFLPFGYHKSFVINVGSADDTKVGEFYLEPSKDLSERKTAADGTTYRELNGTANVVFKPKAVLKNAEVTVSVEGEGVSIIPPVIDFDPSTVKWDYSWDFTKEIPKDLTGNAFMFDGAATFNGKDTRLQLPDSADKFEDGPVSIYAEWTPTDSSKDDQQITGHYNWEITQNKDCVTFSVGRMNNTDGQVYKINKTVDQSFWGYKHNLLAVYSPSENGYIELFLDNYLVDHISIGNNKTWADYGKYNLSWGWSPHNSGTNPHIMGSINKTSIVTAAIIPKNNKFNSGKDSDVQVVVAGTGKFEEININVNK